MESQFHCVKGVQKKKTTTKLYYDYVVMSKVTKKIQRNHNFVILRGMLKKIIEL